MGETEFVTQVTSSSPSDPAAAAFRTALIENAKESLDVPEGATVTIKSITFVSTAGARRRRELATLGAGKNMVVEYEIRGLEKTQKQTMDTKIANQGEDVKTKFQQGFTDAKTNNEALKALIVKAEVKDPPTTT